MTKVQLEKISKVYPGGDEPAVADLHAGNPQRAPGGFPGSLRLRQNDHAQDDRRFDSSQRRPHLL